jgi:hypothetical protein
MLAKTATFKERHVLGRAKFSDDITITHTDSDYMKKYYQNSYDPSQAISTLSGIDQSTRLSFAKDNFKPMYYIKEYASDQSKLEMSFDCTNYQSQFPPTVDFESHIFQTIFLNKARDRTHWSLSEIDEQKIIRVDWWHQLCHSFTHYLFVVPWIMFLQGKRRTRFAGSWTLLNAHEVALLSGVAAAVDLGAEYPRDLERDGWALLCFRCYYLLAYGKWYRRRLTKGEEGEGKDWATGVLGSVYSGPGVSATERSIWREEMVRGMEGGSSLSI